MSLPPPDCVPVGPNVAGPRSVTTEVGTGPDATGEVVVTAMRRTLAGRPRGSVVLAVSGGRDSMGMLAAAAESGLADRVATVAVFDHRTGPAATSAAQLVVAVARRLGFGTTRGMARETMAGGTEAEWRGARWDFLRRVAGAMSATVATAHTSDDQLETVVYRAWRGAGPRGLAGLDVDDGPVRPLLAVSRADVAAFVASRGVAFVDDPSNDDRRHARVRWRLDLLPAIAHVAPGFGASMAAVGQRAAAWRREVDALVSTHVVRRAAPHGVLLDLGPLADVPAPDLAWIWPAMLAPYGIVADRRSIARLAAGLGVGRRASLPGGATIAHLGDGRWLLRTVLPSPTAVPLGGHVSFGTWRLRRVAGAPGVAGDTGPWHAQVPAGIELVVRAWQPGDRLVGPAGPRRVTRWLADAGIPGPLRAGWPVVAAGANVWWIPGVRQAELPPGAPYLSYDCDRQPD